MSRKWKLPSIIRIPKCYGVGNVRDRQRSVNACCTGSIECSIPALLFVETLTLQAFAAELANSLEQPTAESFSF